MASKASAVWTGSLKEGKGVISTATGVLSNANYSFATRFEGADSGTTPEELIAAAHASCYSMALGATLGGEAPGGPLSASRGPAIGVTELIEASSSLPTA